MRRPTEIALLGRRRGRGSPPRRPAAGCAAMTSDSLLLYAARRP